MLARCISEEAVRMVNVIVLQCIPQNESSFYIDKQSEVLFCRISCSIGFVDIMIDIHHICNVGQFFLRKNVA